MSVLSVPLIINREGAECLGPVLASPARTSWRKAGCSLSKKIKQLVCYGECVLESSTFAFVFVVTRSYDFDFDFVFDFDFDLTYGLI
jgi:hypothetical protein